jgi:hypothetical protein
MQRNSKLATASKPSLCLTFAEFYVQHDKNKASLFETDNLCKLKKFKTPPLLFYTDVAKGVFQHSVQHCKN